MKNITRNILAGTLLIALPLSAMAHEGSAGTQPECGDFRAPPMMNVMAHPNHMMAVNPPMGLDMLPPQLAELAHLKDLDLSDDQGRMIFDLIYGLAPTIFENGRIAHHTMEALQQLALADKFNAAKARTLAEEHSKAMSELIYLHAETQSRILAMLTEAQRRVLAEKMHSHDFHQ